MRHVPLSCTCGDAFVMCPGCVHRCLHLLRWSRRRMTRLTGWRRDQSRCFWWKREV